jgi:hypothetical protein
MYRATFKKKELLLSNKDYKQILRRFNLKNFKSYNENSNTVEYENLTECPLCERYSERACVGCTFEKLAPKDGSRWSEGCMIFMASVVDYNMDSMPYITYDTVSYDTYFGDDEFNSDKDTIQKIYNLFLTKFKKVENPHGKHNTKSRK